MKKRSGKNLIRFFYHLLVVIAMSFPLIYSALDYGTNQIQQKLQADNIINVDNLDKVNYGYNDIDMPSFLKYIYSNVSSLPINSTERAISGTALFVVYNQSAYATLIFDFDNTSQFYNGALRLKKGTEYIYFSYTSTSFAVNEISQPCSFTDLYTGNVVTPTITSRTIYLKSISFDYIASDLVKSLLNSYLGTLNTLVFDYSFDKSMDKINSMLDYQFLNFDYLSIIGSPTGIVWEFINTNIQWILTIAVISFAPYVLLTFYHLAIGLLDKFMKKGEEL